MEKDSCLNGVMQKILNDTSGLMEHTLVMLLDFCHNIENEEYHKVQKQEGHQEILLP